MSWRDAPLYVEAHDLGRWLMERTEGWPASTTRSTSRIASSRWSAGVRGIADWLMTQRGLRLKHSRARVLSCHGHLDALGYRIRRDEIRCLKRPLRRLHRRIRQHLDGTLDVDLERSIASSVGIILF